MSLYLHRLSDAKAEQELIWASLKPGEGLPKAEADQAVLWKAAALAGYLAARAKDGVLSRRRARRLCRVLVGVSRAEFGELLRMAPRQRELELRPAAPKVVPFMDPEEIQADKMIGELDGVRR